MVCCKQRVRGRLCGEDELRCGYERALLVALDGRGVAGQEGEVDLREGVADGGEREPSGGGTAVLHRQITMNGKVTAESDHGRTAQLYFWRDVDCIADRSAVAATVNCEGFQGQRHRTECSTRTDYLVRCTVVFGSP